MMAGFVLITFAILIRYAGGWGFPTSASLRARLGVREQLHRLRLHPTTLAEVEFYADIDLPDDTRVVEGVYRSTHDYQLDALLEVPAASAPAALKSLNEPSAPVSGASRRR